MIAFRIKSITSAGDKLISSQEMETMLKEISNMKTFLSTHENFLVELRDMLKVYMRQRDSYVIANTYVTEFIEKYEEINLKGYNSGNYAYREGQQIFDESDKKKKGAAEENADESKVEVPIAEKGITIEGGKKKLSVMGKFKKALGMKVTESGKMVSQS